MYLIGYDLGSSSIKAALVEAESGKNIQVVQYPETEMEIISNQTGWAEQDPDHWWECICKATHLLLEKTSVDPKAIKSIGIAYQMHGLVIVDKNHKVLRPSIIWCDSRAVSIGDQAFENMGNEFCLSHYLNSPGNFTASKLKWVKDNEPNLFKKIHKIMLPGDFIAMKMTDKINTTISGLSEGVLWDFKNHTFAKALLQEYGIDENVIPNIVDTFSPQGQLTSSAANELGLDESTTVTYRAGDQPNNALSLGVFNTNEVAATGGTSGVVYGVVDQYLYDSNSRVNSFAHVNHDESDKRVGILLCINGAGIQYAWMKKQMADNDINYKEMEKMVEEVAVGADGLRILPFGNGAERMLNNKNTGAYYINVEFNRHSRAHFYRAALEGIAFSFVYGFQVMKQLGLNPEVIKVGNDNLFQSKTFAQTISSLMNCKIEIVKTTGAIGAAKASGVGIGIYNNLKEAFSKNDVQKVYAPQNENKAFQDAYELWEKDLNKMIAS